MADIVGGEASAYLEGFEWDSAALAALASGPVMADLIRRAIRVQTVAMSGWNAPPGPPGGKPGVRTGTLRRSITWWPGIDELSPYVDVGSAVVYAPYVELGTSRMAARPFLRPALEAARSNVF